MIHTKRLLNGEEVQVAREELGRKWRRIPGDTDILVTHMPPRGTRDRNTGGTQVGRVQLDASIVP